MPAASGRRVGEKIQAVGAAVGQTDTQAVSAAVKRLEDLRLAVLQLEETTGSLLGKTRQSLVRGG